MNKHLRWLVWQSPVGAIRFRGGSLRARSFLHFEIREGMPKPALTLDTLKEYASDFLRALSELPIPELYRTTDGKAVGTFVEHAFNTHLQKRFDYTPGNAASGIDFRHSEST